MSNQLRQRLRNKLPSRINDLEHLLWYASSRDNLQSAVQAHLLVNKVYDSIYKCMFGKLPGSDRTSRLRKKRRTRVRKAMAKFGSHMIEKK